MKLDLEGLRVESTVMQPEYSESLDAASILYDTQTHEIKKPNTYSSPCVA